jgi:hypothetical protein
MTHRPSKTAADLTQEWPEDPANDDLARLSQELLANRPELSQLALDRIQIRMRREMNRPWWQRRWRTVIGALFAAVALSMGIGAVFMLSKHESPRYSGSGPASAPAVRDRYEVTLPGSSPKPPDKPLIDLGRYNDLIRGEGKERKR